MAATSSGIAPANSMSLLERMQQQVWQLSDADLQRELERFQEAIEANQMPEMVSFWQQMVADIEREMEGRALCYAAWSKRQPIVIF